MTTDIIAEKGLKDTPTPKKQKVSAPLTNEQRAAVKAALDMRKAYIETWKKACIVAAVLHGFTKCELHGIDNVAALFADDKAAKVAFSRGLVSSFHEKWQTLLDGSRLQMPQRAALLSAAQAYTALEPQHQPEALLVLRGELETSKRYATRAMQVLLHTPKLKEQFFALLVKIDEVEATKA